MHNLSILDNGIVEMAYAGERPWHGLGTAVPGLMKTDEALRAAHLDWSVEKVPALSSFDMSIIPDAFAVIRSDNHAALGIVGNQYTVIDNTEAFGFFDAVLGEGQGQIETAAALGRGEKVFMMARMPSMQEIVPGDSLEQFLLVSTSHNGTSHTEVTFTNVRVVCQNTLTMALAGQKNRLKIRHTRNYKERLEEAQRTLAESRAYWAEVQAACQHLAATSVSRVEVGVFMDAMFPQKEDAKRKTAENNRQTVLDLFEGKGGGSTLEGVSGTAWGLFNAYTEYLDHHKSVKGAGDDKDAKQAMRWERSVFGASYNDRQKAFDALMAMAA